MLARNTESHAEILPARTGIAPKRNHSGLKGGRWLTAAPSLRCLPTAERDL